MSRQDVRGLRDEKQQEIDRKNWNAYVQKRDLLAITVPVVQAIHDAVAQITNAPAQNLAPGQSQDDEFLDQLSYAADACAQLAEKLTEYRQSKTRNTDSPK